MKHNLAITRVDFERRAATSPRRRRWHRIRCRPDDYCPATIVNNPTQQCPVRCRPRIRNRAVPPPRHRSLVNVNATYKRTLSYVGADGSATRLARVLRATDRGQEVPVVLGIRTRLSRAPPGPLLQPSRCHSNCPSVAPSYDDRFFPTPIGRHATSANYLSLWPQSPAGY